MFGPTTVYVAAAVPIVIASLRLLHRGERICVLYSLLLYTTFLGGLGRGSGISLAALLAALVVAVELGTASSSRRPWARPIGLDAFAVSFAAWCVFLVAARSSMGHGDLGPAREPFLLLLIVVAGKMRPDFTDRQLRYLAWTLVLGGVVATVACIAQDTFDDPTLFGTLDVNPSYVLGYIERPPGLHGNPNATALYLVIGAAATMTLLRWGRPGPWIRVVLVAAVATMVWGLILAQSRSGLMSVLLVISTSIAAGLGLGRKAPFVVVGFAIGILLVMPDGLVEVGELLLENRDVATSGRQYHWSRALEIVGDDPIFGHARQVSHGEEINYHSDVVHLAAYFGIPAAVLFMAMLGSIAVASWRAMSPSRATGLPEMMFLVLLGATLHGLFHVILQSGICFWLVMSIGINNDTLRRDDARRRASRK